MFAQEYLPESRRNGATTAVPGACLVCASGRKVQRRPPLQSCDSMHGLFSPMTAPSGSLRGTLDPCPLS
jgi:hypothetical protein